MKKETLKFNDGWCFALVNGRLAEIYFKKRYGIYAHCYIRKEKFNKSEQKMIEADTKKCRFTYRKGYYFDKIRKIKQKVASREKIFPRINLKNCLTLDELKIRY